MFKQLPLTFDDVLLVPKYCGFESRKEVDISAKLGDYEFQIPIISSNMDTITGHVMAGTMAKLGGMGILHRFMTIDDNVHEFGQNTLRSDIDASQSIGISVGVNEGLDRVKALYDCGAKIFCVDVAHGHSKLVGKMIKQMKKMASDILIIAGNVCTYAGADYLVGCGADVIKVGVGPGSICETRIKTGFGMPQLSAIMDCARCAKPIIADGGIRTPGDVVKALAAGATMVMLGGMLAGCDETPGEIISTSNMPQQPEYMYNTAPIIYKKYRGMASREAYEDFFGTTMPNWKTSEGISVKVPCKGPVENVIKDIIGGLRSGLTYCGAENIKELQRGCEFIQITQAGKIESTAHYK